MKFKIFLIFFALFFLIAPVSAKTTGYLSFDFAKGQEESDVSKGTFQNAQLGLILSGEIARKINYLSEALVHTDSKVEIEQAWLGLQPSKSFQLKLGLYLVPFGRYNQFNRPHQTMLINPPLIVDYLFPVRWRDIGILAEGRISIFFYSAYLGNGLSESQTLNGGQQFRDNNANKAKGLRLGAFPSRGIEVAYSCYKGKFDDQNRRNLFLQGVDLKWEANGIQICSEYYKAHIENPEDFPSGSAEGYYIQASFEIKGLLPVVSYQKIKYADEFHGQGFVGSMNGGKGISIMRNCWSLGLVCFISGNVLIKAEYDMNREEKQEKRNNVLSAQAAFSF